MARLQEICARVLTYVHYAHKCDWRGLIKYIHSRFDSYIHIQILCLLEKSLTQDRLKPDIRHCVCI